MRRLALATGFQKRKSGKITPFAFLSSSCMKAIEGGCSIGKYTVTLSSVLAKSVSKQAVWKRINPMATTFFLAVLQFLIGNEVALDKCVSKELFAFFPRILIQDSTVIALHKSLFKYFPGSSNQKGTNSSLKIQTVYNLATSVFVFFDITSFRINDQRASKELSFLKKRDLLIRDLGYFTLQSFREIIELKAYFLSRLKYGIKLLDIDNEKVIDLVKMLRRKDTVDLNLLLGTFDKLPVRLVGEKLPDDIANKRRREYRQNRDRNLNPSKEHLELLGWNLFITNIPQDIWRAATIISVYSLRWRIEIIFKSWKSCLGFNLKYKLSPQQVLLLVYSRLIIVTIFTTYFYPVLDRKVAKKCGRHLSLFKFIDTITSNADKILSLFESNNTREQKLLMDILIKNATYEKRKRLNYIQLLIIVSSGARDKTKLRRGKQYANHLRLKDNTP